MLLCGALRGLSAAPRRGTDDTVDAIDALVPPGTGW